MVECLTQDRGDDGSSLTIGTDCIMSLSKTNYPLLSTDLTKEIHPDMTEKNVVCGIKNQNQQTETNSISSTQLQTGDKN